jgi:ParB-like chromosome segregation protein Spo0J
MSEEIKDVFEDYVFDIDLDDQVHILKCFNNESRPEDKQMKITLQLLSCKQKDSITRKAARKALHNNKLSQEKADELYFDLLLEYTFTEKVKKIENIFFKINGKVKEIKKADELYKMQHSTANIIVTEIKDIMNKQEEVPVKN